MAFAFGGLVSRLTRVFSKAKPVKPFKVVMDVKRQSMTEAFGQWLHEERKAGDLSHVDLSKTVENMRSGFQGHDTNPKAAAEAYIKANGLKVDKRNTKPITSFVLSASHEYFSDGKGGFDRRKTALWVKASLAFLQDEFGSDLVHFSLHLDEKTPHIHAKVVPTYEKKTKRGTSRQVSHHKHKAFKGKHSYANLLDRYARYVAPLGIERGDRVPEGARADAKTARQWVNDMARKIAGQAQAAARLEERVRQVGKREEAVEKWAYELATEAAELNGYRKELVEYADALGRKERDVSERERQVEALGKVPPGTYRQRPPVQVEPPAPRVEKRVEKRARRSATLKGKAPGDER
jgi:hypothetical protein